MKNKIRALPLIVLITILVFGAAGCGTDKTPEEMAQMKVDLLAAAERGDTTEVERLLSESADVNGKDDFDLTALMKASTEGHARTIRVLIDKGAEVS